MRRMFSTGWRRYFVHFGRRWTSGLRDAMIAIFVFMSLLSLINEIGNFIVTAAEKNTLAQDTGYLLLILSSAMLAMSVLFAALDAWMLCLEERQEFRRRMGFEDIDK